MSLGVGKCLKRSKVFILRASFCVPAFYSQSAVCVLHSVCILTLIGLQSAVRSPQSALYTDRKRNGYLNNVCKFVLLEMLHCVCFSLIVQIP